MSGIEHFSIDRAVTLFLRHVAVERGLSRNTQAAYQRDLRRYAEWLNAAGITDLATVRPEVVTDYALWLGTPASAGGAGVAAGSAVRMLSTVRSLHRFLLAEERLDADPTEELSPPKLPSRLPKAISIEQMAALLDAVDGEEPEQLRDKALFELLYATGARISEVTALTVDDILEQQYVRLLGKGGKQRIVPVGEYAQDAVQAYLVRARPIFSARGRATPALFLGVRGAALSRNSAWVLIRAAASRAGFAEHISPHTFRHSFATHLLAGGADVRVVQELLGHASVATTQIYTKVTIDTLRDVYLGAHPRAR